MCSRGPEGEVEDSEGQDRSTNQARYEGEADVCWWFEYGTGMPEVWWPDGGADQQV